MKFSICNPMSGYIWGVLLVQNSGYIRVKIKCLGIFLEFMLLKFPKKKKKISDKLFDALFAYFGTCCFLDNNFFVLLVVIFVK